MTVVLNRDGVSTGEEPLPLVVNELCITTTKRVLVESVSLEVKAGQIVALVGPSGSGKTLTALAVCGLLNDAKDLRVAGGSILLCGHSVTEMSEDELSRVRGAKVGIAFQEPASALNPYRLVGSQLQDPLRFHGVTRARDRLARVRSTLASVQVSNVEKVMRAFPRELSGGERQRLLIGHAIILSPRLLILDEPTTALDAITRAEILALVSSLRRDGAGVLLITHDTRAVRKVADHAVMLERGRVTRSGPPDAVTQERRLASPNIATPATPTSAAPVLVRADNITKCFPSDRARSDEATCILIDMSFDVRVGERVGLVGGTGSGKTTLARCLAGLTRPTRGKLMWSASATAEAARRQSSIVQMIYQDFARSFDPTATIQSSLTEGALAAPSKERRNIGERILAMSEAVGLAADTLKAYPSALSGGQRQRAAIARALLAEPILLIADEPVTSLDENLRNQILDLLLEQQQERNFALLLISHDLDAIARVCERALVIDQQRIVEDATVTQLLTSPTSSYSRRLVDAYTRDH